MYHSAAARKQRGWYNGGAMQSDRSVRSSLKEKQMTNEALAAARDRIAAQLGELRGWRPLTVGDVAVTAVQVLGMARGAHGSVGIRVILAGRTAEALGERGAAVAEHLLRRRAVLGPDDPFVVEHMGEVHDGDGES